MRARHFPSTISITSGASVRKGERARHDDADRLAGLVGKVRLYEMHLPSK